MIIRGVFVNELEAYLWANAAERVGGEVVSITFAPNSSSPSVNASTHEGWRVFARVDNVSVTKAQVDEEFEALLGDITYRKAFEAH